jgi:Domain of unknown function (DUF4258)
MPPRNDEVKKSFAEQTYLFTEHASSRAAKRKIFSNEIEEAVLNGEVIEDYPDDKYGPSCLILGVTKGNRVLHIQISYPPNIKIITVYEPSLDQWESDWKVRKPNAND